MRLSVNALLIALLALFSCANSDKEKDQVAAELELNEDEVTTKAAAVKKDAEEIDEDALVIADNAPSFGLGDVPQNAKPGQCFSKVIIPAKFKWEKERVLVSPEVTRYKTVPAQYRTVSKKIMVNEASEKLVSVPATYKWIAKKVLVSEASERHVKVPAKFKTVTKRIKIRDEVVEWKRGDQPGQSDENDALCLVKKPAVFKTVTENILVSPESHLTKEVPAVYKKVNVKVVDQPATVKKVIVPAQYKIVKVRKLVGPAKKVAYKIPASFQTVTKRVKLSDSNHEWREVLCKTNTNRYTIKRIQNALKTAGYNPGYLDGVLGKQTAQAIKSYQIQNGLPTGGLTLETVKHLKVNP